MTGRPDTDAGRRPPGDGAGRHGDGASWADGIERLIRRSQADPALHRLLDKLQSDTTADLLESECAYRHEFAALYGPGLAAMREGDFVSAAPGPDFGPED